MYINRNNIYALKFTIFKRIEKEKKKEKEKK